MYKTQYAAALAANNITREDLLPKYQQKFDEVVNIEKELKEAVNSLTDIDDSNERTEANGNIERISTILATMDADLVKKINANKGAKLRVEKMHEGVKNKAKNKLNQTNAAAAGAAAPAASAAATTPAAAATPAATETPAQQAAPVVEKKAKTEKKSWLGLIIAAAITVAATGYGIHANANNLWPFKKK